MRTKRAPLILILVLALLGSAVLSSSAVAKRHQRATTVAGTIVLRLTDNVAQPPTTEGAITVTAAEAHVTFTGAAKGPAVERYTSVTMPNSGPTLQFGTGSFTGKVRGHRGTLTYVFSGDAANGGLITITGGTGQLAGATGHLAYYPARATAEVVTFGYTGVVTLARR
jgi:hypothetical protein